MITINKLNKRAKEYQPLINVFAFLVGIFGIYMTFLQVLQTSNDLSRNIYQFNGEQFPSVDFKIMDKKMGILKLSIIQSDMLFQACRVSYHKSLLKDHQELIGKHDSIWFNAALFSMLRSDEKLNERIRYLMNEKSFNSYMIVRTPLLLELNYVKYGESRLVFGSFDMEFICFKDFSSEKKELEFEIRAIYFNEYLKNRTKGDKKLNELEKFQVVEGA